MEGCKIKSCNKGFTLLECLFCSVIISIILLTVNRLYTFAYDNYDIRYHEQIANDKADTIYNFLKDRMNKSIVVNLYVSTQTLSNKVLVTYADPINNNFFYSLECILHDSTNPNVSISLNLSGSTYELKYQTQMIEEGITDIRVNKNANCSIVTISYQVINSDATFYYIMDLQAKGMDIDE